MFSPKGSVPECVSSLMSFCYSPVYFLSRIRLCSNRTCADAPVVYRRSHLNILLFKEIKQTDQ